MLMQGNIKERQGNEREQQGNAMQGKARLYMARKCIGLCACHGLGPGLSQGKEMQGKVVQGKVMERQGEVRKCIEIQCKAIHGKARHVKAWKYHDLELDHDLELHLHH